MLVNKDQVVNGNYVEFDTVECPDGLWVIIHPDKISPEYWKAHSRAWSLPSNIPANLKDAAEGGSHIKRGGQCNWYSHSMAMVPIRFATMPKTEDEYGEICP